MTRLSNIQSNRSTRYKRSILSIGIAAVALTIASGCSAVAISTSSSASGFSNTFNLIQPAREASRRDAVTLSQESIDMYMTFYRNFTPILWADQEKPVSQSFSVFDAYVNLAMLAYFSTDDIAADLLPYFGSPTLEALANSVKELTPKLGTPLYGYSPDDPEYGGYSANSLWYDPTIYGIRTDEVGQAAVQAFDEQFYGSIINGRPTAETIGNWLEDTLPKGYDIPDLGDVDSDLALVSSYFLKINNPDEEEEKNNPQYFDYHLNDAISKIRMGSFGKVGGTYYESDTLIGGVVNTYNIAFYQTKDKDANPGTILDDVLNRSYKNKSVTGSYSIQYPYFTLDKQELNLLDAMRADGKPLAGVPASKLVGGLGYIAAIRQFSKVNLDYSGFYAASVTITERKEGAAMGDPKDTFELTLDRPFVFESRVNVQGSKHLPVVIGTIYDPAWAEH